MIKELFNGKQYQHTDIYFAFVNWMRWQRSNQLFVIEVVFVLWYQVYQPPVHLNIPTHGVTGQLPLIHMTNAFGISWLFSGINNDDLFFQPFRKIMAATPLLRFDGFNHP